MPQTFKQNPSQLNLAKNRWTSSHVATLAAAIFGVFLLANAILLFRSLSEVHRNTQLVTHSFDVLRRAETILALYKDLHIGSRGFLLTGHASYLAPLDRAEAKIYSEIDELIRELSDNKDQQSRVRQIREMVDQFLTMHTGLVSEYGKLGAKDAVKTFVGGRSSSLFNLMQRVMTDFSNEERRILKERLRVTTLSEDSMSRSLVFTTIANFVLVILTGWFMRRFLKKQDEDSWVSAGYAVVADTIRDHVTEEGLCEAIIAELAKMSDAAVANIYVVRGDRLKRSGSFGASYLTGVVDIKLGEGLVGEAARHMRIIQLDDIPASHLSIQSSLGSSECCSILIFPVSVHGQLIAVIELGGFSPFSIKYLRLLKEVSESIGAALESAAQQTRLNALLAAMEIQTAELASKEEVLRESNKELETQASVLETQKEILADRNRELELVRSELERRAVDLEKAGKYKSEFLANMSHELRTPLNSLLILASLLLENKSNNLSAKELEFLRTIHRSGTDLLALINDVLDLSKVAAGKLEIVIERIEVKALAESLSLSFKPLAEAKGLDFLIEITSDCPEAIESDGQRVEQILRNFLSNALKFTKYGHIKTIFKKAKNGGLDITVADTGIGIPASKLDAIFQAFQQGDGSTSRQFGGTGLGLTISRDLGTLLGGTIFVSSTVGQGSQFTLALPLAQDGRIMAESAALSSVQRELALGSTGNVVELKGDYNVETFRGPLVPAEPVALFKGKKVLIVDDDMRNVYALMNALQMRGITVVTARHGREAIDVLSRTSGVAMVLMDIVMPVMDGLEAMRHIREDDRFAQLPIIALTSRARQEDSADCIEAGASDYLAKPVELNMLVSQMSYWLESQATSAERLN